MLEYAGLIFSVLSAAVAIVIADTRCKTKVAELERRVSNLESLKLDVRFTKAETNIEMTDNKIVQFKEEINLRFQKIDELNLNTRMVKIETVLLNIETMLTEMKLDIRKGRNGL